MVSVTQSGLGCTWSSVVNIRQCRGFTYERYGMAQVLLILDEVITSHLQLAYIPAVTMSLPTAAATHN